MIWFRIRMAGVLVCLLMVAGCAITPKALTQKEHADSVKQDLLSMFTQQEPVTGPITLQEAMARAIKYNLDHRLKLMEQAFSEGQLESARYELLPDLTLNAGYHNRNNISASSSESIIDGTETLATSTSLERNWKTRDATFVWNILDFGVSYAQAKQQADQILISKERRRKVVQNIIQDIRYAYWRAASAQRLLGQMDEVLKRSNSALKRAGQLESLRLQTPIKALNYQKALLEIVRQMWSQREELASAKTELASLINLKPGIPFTLAIPSESSLSIAPLEFTVEEIEEAALNNRPEIREEHYQARISALEVRKAMMKMLPGLEINARPSYDSNRFLYNNHWTEAGLSVSWNIFNLFTGPAAKKVAEAKVEVDDARRMSMNMAVLTQAHLSFQRYQIALKNYETARKLMNVEKRIQSHMEAKKRANAENELEVIRSMSSALSSRMQHDLGYAELQNARGRIYNSIGLDPLPEEIASHDIPTLANAIEQRMNNMDKGTFKLVKITGKD